MYQSITIGTLSKMIPFFDFSLVEKLSVDAVKYNFLSMKVDHLKGAVLFGNVVCYLCLYHLHVSPCLCTFMHLLRCYIIFDYIDANPSY